MHRRRVQVALVVSFSLTSPSPPPPVSNFPLPLARLDSPLSTAQLAHPLMLNDSRPCSGPHFLLPHAAAGSPSPAEPRRMGQPSSSGRGGPTTTPRRQLQLQGPRPPRLNVSMESHAIKKPSASGPSQAQGKEQGRRDQHHHQQQLGRAPVIIYDASPKVIHAKPSEFMALVQRLTGPAGPGAPPPLPDEEHRQADDDDMLGLGQPFLPPELLLSPSVAMSPAARLATIERSVRPLPEPSLDDDDGSLVATVLISPARRPGTGILSPLPSSLPPAAASGVFSPLPFDVSSISWLNELSPILRAAASGAGVPSNGASRRTPLPYYSDPFVPSPRNLFATPSVLSPTTCVEFFGSLPDF